MVVHLKQLNVSQKCHVLAVLFIFFLFVQTAFHPFITTRLNYLENNLIITILMTILLANLYDISIELHFKVFLTVALVLANIQFLISSLRMILLYKFHKLMNSKFFKLLDCFNFFKEIAGLTYLINVIFRFI